MECEYSTFGVITTYAEFPSQNYADLLRESEDFRARFTKDLNLNRIRESVLRLNIYFKWVDVFYYEEEPEMDFNQFLSNVGGQLGRLYKYTQFWSFILIGDKLIDFFAYIGLFLGISLLSVFEIIDLVYLFVKVCVLKAALKRAASTTTASALTEKSNTSF